MHDAGKEEDEVPQLDLAREKREQDDRDQRQEEGHAERCRFNSRTREI